MISADAAPQTEALVALVTEISSWSFAFWFSQFLYIVKPKCALQPAGGTVYLPWMTLNFKPTPTLK